MMMIEPAPIYVVVGMLVTAGLLASRRSWRLWLWSSALVAELLYMQLQVALGTDPWLVVIATGAADIIDGVMSIVRVTDD